MIRPVGLDTSKHHSCPASQARRPYDCIGVGRGGPIDRHDGSTFWPERYETQSPSPVPVAVM
jgi:hypothetical protein